MRQIYGSGRIFPSALASSVRASKASLACIHKCITCNSGGIFDQAQRSHWLLYRQLPDFAPAVTVAEPLSVRLRFHVVVQASSPAACRAGQRPAPQELTEDAAFIDSLKD